MKKVFDNFVHLESNLQIVISSCVLTALILTVDVLGVIGPIAWTDGLPQVHNWVMLPFIAVCLGTVALLMAGPRGIVAARFLWTVTTFAAIYEGALKSQGWLLPLAFFGLMMLVVLIPKWLELEATVAILGWGLQVFWIWFTQTFSITRIPGSYPELPLILFLSSATLLAIIASEPTRLLAAAIWSYGFVVCLATFAIRMSQGEPSWWLLTAILGLLTYLIIPGFEWLGIPSNKHPASS